MSSTPSSNAHGADGKGDVATSADGGTLSLVLGRDAGKTTPIRLRPVQQARGYRVDGDTLHFEIADDQHAYLSSDDAGDFKSPPPDDSLALMPSTWYVLRGTVVAEGAPATLWLIEYSADQRLAHVRHVLHAGPLELSWRTHADHRRARLALKLVGSGRVALANLELRTKADAERMPPSELERFRAELAALPPAEIITLGALSQLRPTLEVGSAAAAEAARDRFFVDAEPMALVPPVDWHADQRPNTGWPQKLNSWFFVEPVLRERDAAEYRAALERVKTLVRHWLQTQSVEDAALPRYVWSAPMCSARLVYLTLLLRELHRCDLLADEDLEQLAAAIATHAGWLSDTRNYRLHHTQGLLMDLALTLAARHAPFMPGAEDWPELARGRFEANLDALVDRSSGFCRAHSPDSQLHIASILAFAARHGVTPAGEADVLGQRIRAALAWFVNPAGYIVPIGDTAVTPAPPDVRERSSETRGLHVFENGGVAVARTDDSHLVFTAGYHNLCHKHADDLSFHLYDSGRPLVVDAGNFGYVAGHPARKYCVSAHAHNGLLIDRKSFALRQQEPYGSAVRATGEDNGWYALLGDNPLLADQEAEHWRLLLYKPGSALLLVDWVTAAGEERTCTRLLHLAPGIGLMQVVPGRYQLNLLDGSTLPVLDWTPTGASRATIYFGLGEPRVQGFMFPDRDVWEAGHTLSLTRPASGTMALVMPLDEHAVDEFGSIQDVVAEQVGQHWRFDLRTESRHMQIRQQGDRLALEITVGD